MLEASTKAIEEKHMTEISINESDAIILNTLLEKVREKES